MLRLNSAPGIGHRSAVSIHSARAGTAVAHAGGRTANLSAWPRSPLAVVARSFAQAPVFAMLDLIAPARVLGLEHLAQVDSPVIFAANHTSHLDTPVLLKALPIALRRRTAVAAAADYFFSNPALGAAAAFGFNAFPFERTTCTGARASVAHCSMLVEDGWSILIYPEGTRSTTGDIASFKHGLGLLAVHLNLPVVPVHLAGLSNVLPKGRLLPAHGGVTVRFGEPLLFDEDTNSRQAAQRVEQAVRGLAEVGLGVAC